MFLQLAGKLERKDTPIVKANKGMLLSSFRNSIINAIQLRGHGSARQTREVRKALMMIT